MIWAQYYTRKSDADSWTECMGSDQIAYLDGRWTLRNCSKHANRIGLQRYGHRNRLFGYRLYRGQRLDKGFCLTPHIIPLYRQEW